MSLKSLQHLGAICLFPVDSLLTSPLVMVLDHCKAQARRLGMLGIIPAAVCITVRIARRLMCTQYACAVSTVQHMLVI